MEYSELPSAVKKIHSQQTDRANGVTVLNGLAERNELICIEVRSNLYVYVGAKQLQAAIAETTKLEQERLNKLEEAHSTLTKVAKGLL